jgi:hypothetical protein
MGTLINRIGCRFGRLRVISRAASRNKKVCWACLCDCGNNATVAAADLTQGITKSCGCLHRETSHQNGLNNKVHGESSRLRAYSPEYRAWIAMKQRCYCSTSRNFRYWGGRGIKVCSRWRTSFPNFLADMGRRPSRGLSLDRINNEGHYTPSNCRWATHQEQMLNRRKRTA